MTHQSFTVLTEKAILVSFPSFNMKRIVAPLNLSRFAVAFTFQTYKTPSCIIMTLMIHRVSYFVIHNAHVFHWTM